MVRSFLMLALASTVMMIVIPSSAKAERKYGMAGCGLGSIVFSPGGSQVSAATTNGTGGQTFGITSGTSNCMASEDMAVLMEQEEFITYNLNTLSTEMAQGQGDVLATFSAKLGCSGAVYDMFTTTLKASYGSIYSAPGAIAVLDESKRQLLAVPELGQNCKYLNI